MPPALSAKRSWDTHSHTHTLIRLKYSWSNRLKGHGSCKFNKSCRRECHFSRLASCPHINKPASCTFQWPLSLVGACITHWSSLPHGQWRQISTGCMDGCLYFQSVIDLFLQSKLRYELFSCQQQALTVQCDLQQTTESLWSNLWGFPAIILHLSPELYVGLTLDLLCGS